MTKTERITILATPEFKAFLGEAARDEGVSVSELVRRRCQQRVPTEDEEQLFAELVAQLETSVMAARRSLSQGIRDAETTLREIRSQDDDSRPPKTAVSR